MLIVTCITGACARGLSDVARTRALAAYTDFLTLWKDADPDIPILKELKAEYAETAIASFDSSRSCRYYVLRHNDSHQCFFAVVRRCVPS